MRSSYQQTGTPSLMGPAAARTRARGPCLRYLLSRTYRIPYDPPPHATDCHPFCARARARRREG